MDNFFNYTRLDTKAIKIGNISLGNSNPIRIQSMTNTNTLDTVATVDQCIRIIKNGGELVRITTPTVKEAENLETIKSLLRSKGYKTPIIADIHYSAKVAEVAARFADKIRINPGNYGFSKNTSQVGANGELEIIRKNLKPLVDICNNNGTAIRIGVNHGSLSERILNMYGNTAQGIANSAIEFIEVFESLNFDQLVISLKSSNPKVMVYANRLLVHKMQDKGVIYPIHLGVTEAGEGEDGRIKSAIGIGSLLEEGIGDTIRVSLTEAPEKEIPVAKLIVEKITEKNKEKETSNLKLPIPHTSFKKRKSVQIEKIGGLNKPVVIADDATSIHHINKADYVTESQNGNLNIIDHLNRNVYQYTSTEKITNAEEMLFVEVNYSDLTTIQDKRDAFGSKNIIIVFTDNTNKYVQRARHLFALLNELVIDNPVILKNQLTKNSYINNAINIGSLLVDGLGDGIWLTKSTEESIDPIELSFSILQSVGARISKTEFISCPTCGRTLFDIGKTLREVKEKTGHLKGLKIAVMGCIVNGPGEMADADYGYVGAGKNKVTLYRAKEIVKKNIPQSEALEELVALIKADGKWK